jgi:hypothetical protein
VAIALFLVVMITTAGIGWASAVYVLLTSGLLLIAWLAAAYGWGAMLRAVARVEARTALGRVTTIAVGLGAMSLLALGLGWIGGLNQPVAIGLIALGDAAFIWRLFRRRESLTFHVPIEQWGWLLLVPLAAITITAAMLPAGFLWGVDEPNAYDVVEYHLQVPREWFEAGHIVPLTHNVYSFFPFNVEMHYLLAMHLMGGPWAAQFLAQMMHAAFVGLSVAAVYAAVAERGRFAAVISALFAASAPWIPMLGAIAYDEGGLLLYGTLAIAWAMRGVKDEGGRMKDEKGVGANVRVHPSSFRLHPFLLAGLMAGLACGCKLTGVPMLLVGIPLAVIAVWLVSLLPWGECRDEGKSAHRQGNVDSSSVPSSSFDANRSAGDAASPVSGRPSPPPSPGGDREPNHCWRARISAIAVFVVAGLLVFSPWLIRNYFWVGNPVFPELQSTLGRGYFSPEQSERFYKAHKPRPDQQAMAVRVAELGRQVFGDWRFGFALLPISIIAIPVTIRRRESQFLLFMLLGLTAFWLFETHLQGRFYVLAIPIAGMAVAPIAIGRGRHLLAVLAAGMVAMGTAAVFIQLDEFTHRNGSDLTAAIGWTGFDQSSRFADVVPASPQAIVLVGDATAFSYHLPMSRLHYRTVFDADTSHGRTLLDAWTADLKPGEPALIWIDPGELERFHRTYGTPAITEDQFKLNGRPFRLVEPLLSH